MHISLKINNNKKYGPLSEREIQIFDSLKYLNKDIIKIIISMDYFFEGRVDKYLIDHTFFVSSIQMLSDGRIVSSGGFKLTDEQLGGGIRARIYDKNIIVWDQSGNELITISTSVRSMLIMKNDNIAITDNLNNLKIFNF